MTGHQLRVVYVGRDIELRIISLLVRAGEIADEVILVDTGSKDRTIQLAEEFGCKVLHCGAEMITAPKIAKFINDSNLTHKINSS